MVKCITIDWAQVSFQGWGSIIANTAFNRLPKIQSEYAFSCSAWAKSFLKRIGANKKSVKTLPKQLETAKMASENKQE